MSITNNITSYLFNGTGSMAFEGKVCGAIAAGLIITYALYLKNARPADIKTIQTNGETLTYSTNREKLYIEYKRQDTMSDAMKREIAKCIQAFYVSQERKMDHVLPETFSESVYLHEEITFNPINPFIASYNTHYSCNFNNKNCRITLTPPSKISDDTSWRLYELDIKHLRSVMGLTQEYFI